MRKLRLLDEAIYEAGEAAAWYEHERTGLGEEFMHAIESALDLLEADIVPLMSMVGETATVGFKRLVLQRFPYDIVVLPVEDDELVVVAIAHQFRKPGYWRDRKLN